MAAAGRMLQLARMRDNTVIPLLIYQQAKKVSDERKGLVSISSN